MMITKGIKNSHSEWWKFGVLMLFFTLHSSLFTSMAQPKKSRVQTTQQTQQAQQKKAGASSSTM